MDKSDVIIIGAGPAGAVAAHHLAVRGLSVTLLEKETFPRDKTCGDGVTGEGLKVLESIGLGDWSKQFPTFEVLRLSSPDGKQLDIEVKAPAGECYGRTIPRRLLDANLAQAAVSAGARLYEAARVENITIDQQSTRVSAGKQELSSQVVILAEGAHATLARRLGLLSSPSRMIAMRQYLSGDVGPTNRLEIHFQSAVLPGYNWLFPMGDGRVNVGTWAYTRSVTQNRFDLNTELSRFIHDETITEGRLKLCEGLSPPKAHPLRTHLGSGVVHGERLLVAGDAADLVNPLSGEGIAPAMKSGELAAAAVISAITQGDFSKQALAGYARQLRMSFLANYRAARLLQSAFNYPGLIIRAFKNMRQDADLARLVGFIITGKEPAYQALKLTTLTRLIS
jgi:menaquinone-9 beta-reductase